MSADGKLPHPDRGCAELNRLLTLIETAHEHGDEEAIAEQAAHVRTLYFARTIQDTTP